MKPNYKLYNQTRTSTLLIGLAFTVIGIYGLIYPNELSISQRGYGEISGAEKTNSIVMQIIIGVVLLLARFTIFRHRKDENV